MKTIIDKADSRGYANHGWLKTKHTFSFANYYNPEKMHFGALRVLNDDIVAPSTGFDMHPHKNMEVVSIPLKGFLKHGDSIDNTEVITVGDIQVMSAGTGIIHSEYNASESEPVEFLQIWIFPRSENTPPRYKSYDVRDLIRRDHLSLVISPDGSTPASLNQDAWFSIGQLSAAKSFEYKMRTPGNGVYLFVIHGEVMVNDIPLMRRDGLGIYDTEHFEIETLKPSEILLIEVPMNF